MEKVGRSATCIQKKVQAFLAITESQVKLLFLLTVVSLAARPNIELRIMSNIKSTKNIDFVTFE